MLRGQFTLLVFFILTLACSLDAAGANAPAWKWQQTETSVALLDGPRIAWQFNYDPHEAKPYFHPITALDGTLITALKPADHPWHRGLWWSWKYLNGLNYWDEDQSGQSAGKTTITSTQVETNADFSAKITMALTYHPPGAPPLLTEQRFLDVSKPDRNGAFTITWRSTFVAGNAPVVLDRTPIPGEPKGAESGGYAGLSLRLDPRVKDWEYRDSENGQDEASIHGGTARYLKFSAPNGPGVWLWDDEKTNPRFPTTWYASRKLNYVSPAFLYRGPFTLSAGQSLNFGYRVVFNPVIGPAATEQTLVKISTVPGKMKYDIEDFEVKPGSLVTLRLRNDDDMTHNLVLCQAPLSFGAQLGEAALKLGEAGLKKNYVPDLPEIIAHTVLVEPGQGQTINFTAPTTEGEYPYFCTMPGHWVLMKGVMRVTKSARAIPLAPTAPAALPVDEIKVTAAARVDRVPMPDCSPTALAVGLPGGLNYCFDVEKLAVRYAWSGRYLDNAPNMYRRGGDTVRLLGERFYVGYTTSPWLGSNEKPALLFKGYRTDGTTPVLLYTIDDVAFSQTVSPTKSGRGVVYTFEVEAAKAPIHFKIAPAGLTFSATAGNWDQGVLTVPAAAGNAPTRFSITLTASP